jgi:alanyl-tRNA synthetase
VDTYHHTMFEMLGNWSFGDYYKTEAIAWAWELLTGVYKMDPNRLYVTYFEGDESEGLAPDDEALALWKKHIDPARILPGNKKDNFWEMGETGPCGPCSEIHVDLRTDADRKAQSGAELVNNDHPQVVEIWNLVFMEMSRSANGSLSPLPARHIDTGMGLERLAMALQGVTSNYDTDVFQPLIAQLEETTGRKYGRTDEKPDVAFRVASDHIRAIAFAIADGQLPSNTGAGYVIRRILRRAVRYAFSFLDCREPFLHQLVPVLEREMGDVFPELRAQRQLIENVIREEEEAFLRTLENGIARIETFLKTAKGGEMDGKTAFELYDTFGFPIDLTALILSESGWTVDRKSFESELQQQKDRSRKATAIEAADWVMLSDTGTSEFVGYDNLESPVKLIRYRAITIKKKEQYQLVFDRTPFYPEGGGQVGDSGIISNDNESIQILDTKKENNLIIHFSDRLPKNPEAEFTAKVDAQMRQLTASNHSATHLLHHALRNVLGTHVEQKGSLVNFNYLRFDFLYFSKLSDEELEQIEEQINQNIWSDTPLQEHRNVTRNEAQQMGALALFGEKYGDSVRVIQFGDSKELCGGTHVPRLGHIGLLKITSESGIAAGVRRIEALTNAGARQYFNSQLQLLNEVKSQLKNPNDPVKGVRELIDRNQQLQKELEKAQRAQAGNLKGDLINQLEEINGVRFVAQKVPLDAASIKDLSFQMRSEVDNLFMILGSEESGKAMLTLVLGDKLVHEQSMNAGKMIRELAVHIDGGGGGQQFFATAGGKKPEGIDDALRAGKVLISKG